MNCTSAQANKLLKQLQEEQIALQRKETQSRTFVAAITEDIELARPAHDYDATQQRLAKIERDIRVIKHAINAFNLSHTVEGFNMTVDQILVYIPQLSARKEKLSRMAGVLEKTRLNNTGRSNIIEYEYANYDVRRAMEDYTAVSEELSRAQVALDRLNNTETMQIEL